MPSPLHTVLVEVLEAHPEALSYLLELGGHPVAGPLIPTSGTRSRTFTLERRVDRAYLVGSREAPAGFVLAEVQLDVDDDKHFAWALYVELARTRYRCEGALVVLTLRAAVRRWIAQDIATGTGQYGTSRRLEPTVLALDEVEPGVLLRADRPYLATLAVAGHAKGKEARAIAERAVDITVDRLPKPLATEQLDAILGMVDAALRAELESRIMERHRYRSELFQGIYDAGWAEGEAIGKAAGEASGEAKGKAEGEALGILTVLEARGIPVTKAIRTRILGCTDTATLDVWLRRAVLASTAAEVVRVKASPSSTAKGGDASRAKATKAARATRGPGGRTKAGRSVKRTATARARRQG